MEVLNTTVRGINRWDKDSIRPGPVGSVGDVNLQIQLKKSSPDMANRYDYAFSGKNEVWGGANISDGQYTGFTSGGRGAEVATKSAFTRTSFKTSVGYQFQNIVPTDRASMTKMVPLGQYSWDSEKAVIYRAKITGDQFLPLPGGYGATGLTRGSAYPVVIAETAGDGVPLPAAAVNITDPVFGETGSIEIPESGCTPAEQAKYWTPAMDDPIRNDPVRTAKVFESYPFRDYKFSEYFPEPGNNVQVKIPSSSRAVDVLDFSPCGLKERHPSFGKPTPYVPASRRAKEGDSRPKEQPKVEAPPPVNPRKRPGERVQKKQIKR